MKGPAGQEELGHGCGLRKERGNKQSTRPMGPGCWEDEVKHQKTREEQSCSHDSPLQNEERGGTRV